MIHKSLLITATLSVLILSGCSQKAPGLQGAQPGKNNVSDATQIAAETVTINENTYGNENTTNANNGAGNSSNSAHVGKYNSSSDGFQSIYFGFGDYTISRNMENNIAKDSTLVSNSNSRIKIEGNCDEFGTDEYNYALGLKRAKAVKDSIIAQGVSASKMVIISYGESNPVCSNPTDGCYAQNRRVDLRLVK